MKNRIALSIAAIALFAGSAAAQDVPGATELGVDANISIGLGDGSYTQFNLPSGIVRAGFPVTSRVSIEPRGRLSVISGNDNTTTSYSIGVGALFHFNAAALMREGVYVRPALGVFGSSGESGDATFFGGIGLGYKRPIFGQLGSRFEGAFNHNFNNGSSNGLEFSAGLSWFTK